MTIHRFTLPIGIHPSGIPLAVYGYKFESQRPGKHLYIQGGMHGGEVTYWIFQKLYQLLSNHLNAGMVTLIPIASPAAWMSRMYFTTAGKFDWYMGKDWNRNFPGNPRGSLGERMADALLRTGASADIAVDLHTSRHSLPFGIVSRRKNLRLAKAMGLAYTYLEPSSPQSASCFANALEARGIPAMTLECGSHDTYDEKTINQCVASIMRLLASFGSIRDSPSARSGMPHYFTRLLTYRAPNGGFIRYKKPVGETYRKNEVLFMLSHAEDLNKETPITASEDGLLLKQSPTHILWPGDEVVQTVPLSAIKRIR